MKDDLKYLLHIAACIQRVEEDVSGGHAAFEQSHLIQDAVLRNLQVIAESTKRLGVAFQIDTNSSGCLVS